MRPKDIPDEAALTLANPEYKGFAHGQPKTLMDMVKEGTTLGKVREAGITFPHMRKAVREGIITITLPDGETWQASAYAPRPRKGSEATSEDSTTEEPGNDTEDTEYTDGEQLDIPEDMYVAVG